MSTTRIVLVRHAQSQMNVHGRGLVGGRSNATALTDAGVAAARALGRDWRDGPIPDVMVHTSAVRSRQTAQAIVEGAGWDVPMLLEDGLIELSQGEAEGQPRESWWTPAALEAMRADPLGHRLAPGGETHLEVQARMRRMLQRLAADHDGGLVIVVGHGVAMRTLVWSLLGGGHERFRELELPNLGQVHLDVDASGRLTLLPADTPLPG